MAKRLFDIAFALLALLLLGPLLLAVALWVRLDSPGPVFFRQQRVGRTGQLFDIYKFRTMQTGAEAMGPQITVGEDARITHAGAWLRRSKVDELPQFINVLQGRMSIVGPRPHAVAHNETYRKLIKGYMVRHKVRPGITGWAQVNGCRGETETLDKMKRRVDYDLEYLRKWSFLMDVRIILRTIGLMHRDPNAY